MPAEGDHGAMGEQQQEEDLVRLLPDDALAGVLGRLAPRDLAASRCVRKAWRAVVDDRRLLLPHLLPRKLRGIFIVYNVLNSPEFFARPGHGGDDVPAAVSGDLDCFLPPDQLGSRVHDHCNGLFLGYRCVLNPATRRWAPVPQRPPPLIMKPGYFYYDEYLAFDPIVSPHYEVLLIPRIIRKSDPGDPVYRRTNRYGLDSSIEESEWPPSRFVLHVFSSKVGQWEERLFLRHGDAMGTVSDMRMAFLPCVKRYATYWQGEIYVHCEANFVMRISLSDNKYRIIKPPVGIEVPSKSEELYLGKSEKGVYCALVGVSNLRQLRVWTLISKTCDQMEWVLMHQTNLGPILVRQEHGQQIKAPWILNDINYHRRCGEGEAIVQEELEWDSDNDNVIQAEGEVRRYYEHIDILGFHPYKEVVFLSESLGRGLAYHWNSSKFQELGNLYPKNYIEIAGSNRLIRESFPYTPCWMGECPPS